MPEAEQKQPAPADSLKARKRAIMTTTALLTGFAIVGAVLVGTTFISTKDDIELNEKRVLMKQLNTIIPPDEYNNDLILDSITIDADAQFLATAKPSLAYRARKDGKDVAVIFPATAPNGYNGPIDLLVGIYTDGSIAGVRVVKHRETPGLGDAVSVTHSDWILGFDGKSLHEPAANRWKVKRDGGIFDQFTGATITPRAVVKAVHNALLYYDLNKKMLFRSVQPGTDSTQAAESVKDKASGDTQPEPGKDEPLR